MRSIGFMLTLLVTVAPVAATAEAQQRQRGIAVTGVVVDETGAVLPNAQVALKSATGVTVQSIASDASGAFRIDAVAPGRYDVVVTFEGFRPTTVRVTVVGSRAPAPLRVTMPLAGITQEVTVGTAPAQVTTEVASNLDSSTVDANAIENLPVFNGDILATMSRFLDSSAVGTNGATLVVNGVEVNNLMVGTSAIQQIKINQDPYSAEYPRPGRGRIEVVLKPGSQEYHGTGNVIFRDSAFDARNAFATTKPPEQRRIFEGFVSGPVRQSTKTSFSLSMRGNQDDTQSVVFAAGLSGPIQQSVASPYRNVLVAGTLNRQAGENTTLSLTLSYQDQTTHNQGVGGVVLPSAGTNWNFLEQDAIYTHQTMITPRLLNQLRLFVGQEFEPTTSVTAAPKIVVLDAFTGGGAQADQLRTEHHFTLTDMVTWSSGRHTLKAGVNIPDWSRRRFDDNTNTLGTFYFSSLSDYAAGRPYSLIYQTGNGHVAFLEKVVGFFVQDEIRVTPRLSASVGLRYDWQNYFHDTNNFGPRASFAYAVRSDGRTVVRGGGGIFYDRTGPRPIQDLLRYDGIHQLKYVITDPGYPNPFSGVGTSAADPPSVVRLAPDTQLPSTLQYSVSLEYQLAKSTSASVTYTRTRGFHQFLSRDINAPLPPLFAARPDPAFGVVRDMESDGRLVGNSVQFTLRGQVAHVFTLSAQYTLSKTQNDTSGINWVPPNAYDRTLEYARADFDQRHRLDLLGSMSRGPWLNVGAALALYSGRPYSLTTGHDDFNTGVANARPPGVPRNSLNGPDYIDVDVRWWRDVALSHAKKDAGPAVTLGVDAFNVLNRLNATGYVGTLTSPFFRTAVSAQAPRRLQFSLRARF
jgi:Carboxypeptidase regulatory-like domain/TonB dependent receptor